MRLLRYRTIWVTKYFLTPKRFEPRLPFSYTSKYGTSGIFRKKIKFFSPRVFQIFDSKHGSPDNYSDFFFVFFCFFSSSRSRAMRSSRHNSSKILSNWNEISQACSGVNIVVPNTFWVHSVQGVRCWVTSKWKNFAMLFQAGFRNIWIFSWIILCWVEMDLRRARNFILSWLEWQTRMVDPSCKINLLWRHRNEREAINPNSISLNFLR